MKFYAWEASYDGEMVISAMEGLNELHVVVEYEEGEKDFARRVVDKIVSSCNDDGN